MKMQRSLKCLVIICLVLACTGLAQVRAQTLLLSFGHVNVGSSTQPAFHGTYVSNFTSPPNLGNITEINVFLATDGTTARAVIYSDKDEAPDVLLAESGETNVPQTMGSWVSFNVSFVGGPSTVYWLGVHLNGAGTYYYSPGVNDRAICVDDSSDVQSNFPPGSFSSEGDLSAYAIYLSSVVPAVTPTGQTNNWVQMLLIVLVVAGIIIAVALAIVLLRGARRANWMGEQPGSTSLVHICG